MALMIVPAIVMGAIIGLIELIFVHADEHGMGWFIHGLHALPVTMIFVFASMNIDYALELVNLSSLLDQHAAWITIGVRIAIGLIAMLKISGAAAIAGRVGEKFIHVIIIGALVIVSPYIWTFIGPVVSPMLPF